MSVIVDLAIFPMVATEGSLSPYVARVIDVIKRSGLAYKLGPMGTAIEGEWAEVMTVVDACYKELEQDFERIYLTLKIDAKRGRENGIIAKVRSVTDKTK